MLLKAATGLLSPAGVQGRLSILIFHRVLPFPDPARPLIPDVARFDAMLRWTKTCFNVLPLEEAVGRLSSGTLPGRAACITFDDGYADNYLHAWPVLKKHGLHATFFISTGFLDGGIMWNDALGLTVRRSALAAIDCSKLGLGVHALGTPGERATALRALNKAIKHLPYAERSRAVDLIAAQGGVELPTDLMLTSAQLRELRADGAGIGAHTITHPILAACDDGMALREIVGGKRALESILGEEIRLFAYPNGKPNADYRRVHVDMVRGAGFIAALTTAPGAACHGDDAFQIPRYTPWRDRRFGFSAQLVRNLVDARRCAPVLASS